MKRYSELIRLETFEERFDYLKLNGRVAKDTFAFDRVFNQKFYRSKEWKDLRAFIINRDLGCDLGIVGYDIRYQRAIIHHLNPITLDDIQNGSRALFDPENLITTTHNTHNAIHYGDKDLLCLTIVERKPNDTCPWKQ